MNYIDNIIQEIRRLVPSCQAGFARHIALVVLIARMNVTRENVYDAWMNWMSTHHPSEGQIVPFEQCPPYLEEMIDELKDAIIEVAWCRDRKENGDQEGSDRVKTKIR